MPSSYDVLAVVDVQPRSTECCQRIDVEARVNDGRDPYRLYESFHVAPGRLSRGIEVWNQGDDDYWPRLHDTGRARPRDANH